MVCVLTPWCICTPGPIILLECLADLSSFELGLVEETKLTYHDIFGESKEWQNRVIKTDVQDIIARTASLLLTSYGIH